MKANVFIVDDNYTGQGKPLGIVVDTMYFLELIDTASDYHDEAAIFFTQSAAAHSNLYMTAKTNEELMHRLQVYHTVEYAKELGINAEAPKYKKGNPGFKKLQQDLLSLDPTSFVTISKRREVSLNTFKAMADVIYPTDYADHLENQIILQEKLNGCVECSDVATILIANEKQINTYATSDGGFFRVPGINIITPRKGIYTRMASSTTPIGWYDITK